MRGIQTVFALKWFSDNKPNKVTITELIQHISGNSGSIQS